ncbi:MAG TPA: hypothetical protein ENK06_03565 [Gammaproteobacteria bacterium]|nr:hypothetical protein [Gammaproteobacteria bacterium]
MEKNNSKTRKQDAPDSISQRPGLTIDYDLYWHHLENSDLSDQQKRDFLDELWSIIVFFVELGFNVNPLQQAVDQSHKTGTCEQNHLIKEFIAAGTSDVIDSTKPKSHSVNNKDMQSGMSERGNLS